MNNYRFYTKPSNGSTLVLVIFFITLFVSLILVPSLIFNPKKSKNIVKANETKILSTSELKRYDGSDPKLPIYIALDGKIYDVTSGKKYYQKGAVYHFLVGRDSSRELREVSVDQLIKSKYPAVGILTNR